MTAPLASHSVVITSANRYSFASPALMYRAYLSNVAWTICSGCSGRIRTSAQILLGATHDLPRLLVFDTGDRFVNGNPLAGHEPFLCLRARLFAPEELQEKVVDGLVVVRVLGLPVKVVVLHAQVGDDPHPGDAGLLPHLAQGDALRCFAFLNGPLGQHPFPAGVLQQQHQRSAILAAEHDPSGAAGPLHELPGAAPCGLHATRTPQFPCRVRHITALLPAALARVDSPCSHRLGPSPSASRPP